jgi:SAM-dependent methyltransferase
LKADDASKWVVLGQSFSGGWKATLNGVDLGGPSLIDGASMGWRLPNKITDGSKVVFEWMPQQRVWLALWLSLAALLAILALAFGRSPKESEESIDDSVQPRLRRQDSNQSPLVLAMVGAATGLAIHWLLVPVLSLGAVFVASRAKRQRSWTLTTVALFVGAGLSTLWTVQSFLVRDISWPSKVPYANSMTWIGLAMWLIFIVATTHRDLAAADVKVVDDVTPEQPTRRRGLNVPLKEAKEGPDEREFLDVLVAPRGPLRTFALVRAQLSRRRNPAIYEKVRVADALNQVVGQAPLYNRDILEISSTGTKLAEPLTQRGARVVTMRRAIPVRQRGAAAVTVPAPSDDPTYTNQAIDAPDEAFDLVYATNVLSSVREPDAILDEMIRVTRIGGAIVIHNLTWWSPWGGYETSPWHLLSGNLALARYEKKHGQRPPLVYGATLFRWRIRELTKYMKNDPRVAIVQAGPYWLPSGFSWLLKVPVIREIVTLNVAVRLERISR